MRLAIQTYLLFALIYINCSVGASFGKYLLVQLNRSPRSSTYDSMAMNNEKNSTSSPTTTKSTSIAGLNRMGGGRQTSQRPACKITIAALQSTKRGEKDITVIMEKGRKIVIFSSLCVIGHYNQLCILSVVILNGACYIANKAMGEL